MQSNSSAQSPNSPVAPVDLEAAQDRALVDQVRRLLADPALTELRRLLEQRKEESYRVLLSSSDTQTMLRTQGRLAELTFLLGDALPNTLLASARIELRETPPVDYDNMDHELPLDPNTFLPLKETAQ